MAHGDEEGEYRRDGSELAAIVAEEIADPLDARYQITPPVGLARELRHIELFSEKECVTHGIVA